MVPWIELAIGCYFAYTVWYAISTENYFTVPFLLLFVLGYWYTGLLSLLQGRFERSGNAGRSCMRSRTRSGSDAAVVVVADIIKGEIRMRQFVAALLCVVSSVAAQAMDSVPRAEYHARRVALAEKLHGGVAVLFAAEEPVLDFMPYRQDSDFFYLTGWTEPGAALVVIGAGPETVVPRSGEHVPAHLYREILFLPSRNLVIEKYTGVKMDATTPGAAGEAAVDTVQPLNQLPEVLGQFVAEDRRRGRSLWTQTDMPAATAVVSFLGPTLGVDTTAVRAQDVRELTMALRTVK